MVASDGLLYGTTGVGVTYDAGAVLELQPPSSVGAQAGGKWIETMLYSFTGQNGDGAGPSTIPVVGAQGALYGMTGGAAENGTAFLLQPPADPADRDRAV